MKEEKLISIKHLCVSSQKVMFRNTDDFIRFTNILAYFSNKQSVRILAYSIMSNHYHIVLMSDRASHFIRNVKNSYSVYFKSKYGISPSSDLYVSDIEGREHCIVALSYVLRNPVHHGIAHHPFDYPFSSAKCYYRCDNAFHNISKINNLSPNNRSILNLSPRTIIPESFRWDSRGMVLPEIFVERYLAESIFGTPYTFLYFMTRKYGPKWAQEQLETDPLHKAVEIYDIENWMDMDTESDHLVLRDRQLQVPDIQLCRHIEDFSRKSGHESFIQLSDREREIIAEKLARMYRITKGHVYRCL